MSYSLYELKNKYGIINVDDNTVVVPCVFDEINY